jgi:hypothetical protein
MIRWREFFVWSAMFLSMCFYAKAHAIPPSIKCVEHAERSASTLRAFQMLYPCPSTGRRTGACPGYVKDHVTSLCAGGKDLPCNLAYQTHYHGNLKDHWENTKDAHAKLAECRKSGDCFINWPRANTCN